MGRQSSGLADERELLLCVSGVWWLICKFCALLLFCFLVLFSFFFLCHLLCVSVQIEKYYFSGCPWTVQEETVLNSRQTTVTILTTIRVSVYLPCRALVDTSMRIDWPPLCGRTAWHPLWIAWVPVTTQPVSVSIGLRSFYKCHKYWYAPVRVKSTCNAASDSWGTGSVTYESHAPAKLLLYFPWWG